MSRGLVSVVAVAAILLGALTAGSPTMTESPSVATAGIEFGTPAANAPRQEAPALLLTPPAVLRLLWQAVLGGLVLLVTMVPRPRWTSEHLGSATRRRGPPRIA